MRGACYFRSMNFTKLDHCQYLLSSQVNYTLTNFAEYLDSFSHDDVQIRTPSCESE